MSTLCSRVKFLNDNFFPGVGILPGSALVVFGQIISMTMTKNISSMNVVLTRWSLAGTVYIPTTVKIGDGKSDAVG